MAQQSPIQFSHSSRCTYSSANPGFICSLSLIALLSGYIGLSNAAPTAISQEKQSVSAQKNAPTKTQPSTNWVKGRLLVTPRAGLSMEEIEKALKPHGAKPKRHLKKLNLHICELPAGVDEVKAMRALKKDRRFKDVELDMLVAPDQSVTDPSFSSSWALPKIQAPAAWDTTNGDNIIIAILDSGIDSSHPDLAANMVPGWNFYDDNADTTDVRGHGTKVAGAAAAAANNGVGSAGVAWMASIMPVRISDSTGYALFSNMAQGIRWAADHGAKVVNLSFNAASSSSTVRSAAEYMRSKGGVVVVSAGNGGDLKNYAASDALLVASATDSNDQRTSWSSYGAYVDVSAPGVSIYTTTNGGGYGFVSGTSFSSPIVAATAALVLSANSNLTPTDVDQIIKSTAVDLGTAGYDEFYGAGRVNAAAAVAAASGLISVDDQAPTISIAAPTGGEVSGIVPVDVNYSDNVGVVRVELFVGGQKIITDTQSPFAFAWDTTTLADGDHILSAQAFDAAGNMGTSSNVSVSVNNTPVIDSKAPSIAITAPTGGEVLGIVPVNVNATDNVAVVRVELFVNGQKTMTDTQAPFAFNWDTTALTDGSYTLTTKAFDEADNAATSSAVSVTVNNTPPPVDTTASVDTTAPVITSFNLTEGMRVARKQTVNVSATDNQAVAQITLTIDGRQVAARKSSALSYTWNTRARGRFKNTTHTVTVQVSDQTGNNTSKTVTVYN